MAVPAWGRRARALGPTAVGTLAGAAGHRDRAAPDQAHSAVKVWIIPFMTWGCPVSVSGMKHTAT